MHHILRIVINYVSDLVALRHNNNIICKIQFGLVWVDALCYVPPPLKATIKYYRWQKSDRSGKYALIDQLRTNVTVT